LIPEAKVHILLNSGYIDASALAEGMKSLGYEVDKKQISQMIDFLDKDN
jgi:Ca2+-binding EF-hand superfamily protein